MFWAAKESALSSRPRSELKELAYCLCITLSAVAAPSLLAAWDAKLAIEAYFAIGY